MIRQVLACVLGCLLLVAVVAVAGVGPAGTDAGAPATGAGAPATAASPAATPATVREILAGALPASAPGQRLDLIRTTIAPGVTLPIHIHPGTQVAWIVAGELTYHVLTGEVPIGRAAGASTTAAPAPSETLTAGQSTILRPGDWVIEPADAVHYGENLGTEPVVILSATLLAADQPLAIPVTPEGTPIA